MYAYLNSYMRAALLCREVNWWSHTNFIYVHLCIIYVKKQKCNYVLLHSDQTDLGLQLLGNWRHCTLGVNPQRLMWPPVCPDLYKLEQRKEKRKLQYYCQRKIKNWLLYDEWRALLDHSDFCMTSRPNMTKPKLAIKHVLGSKSINFKLNFVITFFLELLVYPEIIICF